VLLLTLLLMMAVIVLKLACSNVELPKVRHSSMKFKQGFFQPRV